jgi:hypothetical protein
MDIFIYFLNWLAFVVVIACDRKSENSSFNKMEVDSSVGKILE